MMSYTRIVFVARLSSIGDVLIATEALNTLSQNGYFPVFVTAPETSAVAELLPFPHATVSISKSPEEAKYFFENKIVSLKELKSLLQQFHPQRPNIFLDLQKTSRSRRARKQLGKEFIFDKTYFVSKKTFLRFFYIILAFLCFSQKKRKKLLNLTDIESIQERQNKVLQKIITLDGKNNNSKENLLLGQQPFQLTKPLLEKDFLLPKTPFICLCPGASGFVKQWPKEYFRKLIDLILEKTPYCIVLCGSKNEANIGEYLDYPSNERIFNFIGKSSLTQTLALLSRSKYVVTNDSFPAHAASYFGIAATVIFGATTPKFGFAPKKTNITVEYANLSCSPCTRHGKSPCRYKNLNCLQEIPAEKVFENIQREFLLPDTRKTILKN